MGGDCKYFFEIAGFEIEIGFAVGGVNDIGLIPSFAPFAKPRLDGEALFALSVDDALKPVDKAQRELIRDFDTGNGHTSVSHLQNGGYQFIVRNTDGRPCCLLISDAGFKTCRCALNGTHGMRSFGLNNALMLVFAFSSCRYSALLVHASLVRHNGVGYAFIAKSGTGKSTQVSNWLRFIPGCDLMNDDNPVVRVTDDGLMVYGSPWSGKTPCYRNVSARLGAVTKIERAEKNYIEKLSPVVAFAELLASCSTMRWDKAIFGNTCDTVTKIIERIGIHALHCLPDRQSAEICAAALVKK